MKPRPQIVLHMQTLHNQVSGHCTLCMVHFPDGTQERFILDCGLFQEEEDALFNLEFPIDPTSLDFAILSHNHLDHSGRFPLLVHRGFEGPIYASHDTKSLIAISLPQAKDSAKDLKKHYDLSAPPFCFEDIEATVKKVYSVPFERKKKISHHITLTFFENGHVPGAVITVLEICYQDQHLNFLFTGDFCPHHSFFTVHDLPRWVLNLPNLYVLIESTYADRSRNDIKKTFAKTVSKFAAKGYTIFCPSFAFSRAQEVLFELKQMQRKKQLDSSIPIYIDGKQTIAYTDLYQNKSLALSPKMYDFLPRNLHYVTSENRDYIIRSNKQKIIVTSSGNASRGPALFYLEAYVDRPNVLIEFTGHIFEDSASYQLTRLPHGEEFIMGGKVRQKLAAISSTNQFTAHASREELIAFLKRFHNIEAVFVHHGQEDVRKAFTKVIAHKLGTAHVYNACRDYSFYLTPNGLLLSEGSPQFPPICTTN